MFQGFKKRKGTTLVEIIIGTSIFMIIMGIFSRWFFMQREYQSRISKVSEIQENFRRATWRMIQELQTARTIIWPRTNSDGSIRSDSRVVFKDFEGNIVSFFLATASKEIWRCVIPNGSGDPVLSPKPIGSGIASATFTSSSMENRLVSIHLAAEGIHSLDAVYLMNND